MVPSKDIQILQFLILLLKLINILFSECSSPENITIPSTVNEIGDYALKDCYYLQFQVILQKLVKMHSLKILN